MISISLLLLTMIAGIHSTYCRYWTGAIDHELIVSAYVVDAFRSRKCKLVEVQSEMLTITLICRILYGNIAHNSLKTGLQL